MQTITKSWLFSSWNNYLGPYDYASATCEKSEAKTW